MKKRVTVVCCANDIERQKKELICSLATQDEPYELITIDNTKGQFSCCASAFNRVLDQIKTKYVVFSHQDIILPQNDQLRNFVDYMERSDIGEIFGVAGVQSMFPGVLTAVVHGSDRHFAGDRYLIGIEECDTIDECFFGGLTETFLKYPFNDILCDGWHFYAVERCLHNRLHGHSVYTCDIPLEHTSDGGVDHAFFVTLRKLCKAYQRDYKEVYSTCDRSGTGFLSRNMHFLEFDIKNEVKLWIKSLSH